MNRNKVETHHYYVKGTPIANAPNPFNFELAGQVIYFSHYTQGEWDIPHFSKLRQEAQTFERRWEAQDIIESMRRKYKVKYIGTHTFEIKRIKVTKEYE